MSVVFHSFDHRVSNQYTYTQRSLISIFPYTFKLFTQCQILNVSKIYSLVETDFGYKLLTI
ncbi:hypothetical protein BpHYR1_007801 [Brachionus plicatilis]|uniref:Uncharacterized protein n=1 Tax=Brachionus plicatilis TaxID=10195 RepID=A0A3M7PQR8_BRAPC|nr:hypothetical protein BpHYR1_007801 [Brachionus plicatilis]